MKIVTSIILIALIAFGFIYQIQQKTRYIGVDSFHFLPGPDASVVVSFGKNKNEFHAFAIRKKDIRTGTTLFSQSKNNTNFAVFAELNEQTFIRSSNHATYAQLSVVDIDKKKPNSYF